ncbi:hypothetical protein [Streptomyces sp. NPDC088115]|uniref:hypothetical protein n=1 Tax=Streptomyces sp. NPDC088115 TaxID=3365824 RepID=UPI0038224182
MNFSVLSADVSPSLAALVPVGLLVVVALIAAVIVGSRRNARQRLTADTHARPAAGERDGQQRGQTWQTIDDDPDQGNPHR